MFNARKLGFHLGAPSLGKNLGAKQAHLDRVTSLRILRSRARSRVTAMREKSGIKQKELAEVTSRLSAGTTVRTHGLCAVRVRASAGGDDVAALTKMSLE